MSVAGWNRRPPLAGPRVTLCWTRYPSNMRTLPSSIFTGKRTTSSRRTSRRTARNPGERLRISAALSNWRCAFSQGESTTAGAATVLTVTSLTGSTGAWTPSWRAQAPHLYCRECPRTRRSAPKDASAAIASGAMLVDVREKSEYDDVHIPGLCADSARRAARASRRDSRPTATSTCTAAWAAAAPARSTTCARSGGRTRTTSAVGSRPGRKPAFPSSTDPGRRQRTAKAVEPRSAPL